jgi:hypothetical protein
VRQGHPVPPHQARPLPLPPRHGRHAARRGGGQDQAGHGGGRERREEGGVGSFFLSFFRR